MRRLGDIPAMSDFGDEFTGSGSPFGCQLHSFLVILLICPQGSGSLARFGLVETRFCQSWQPQSSPLRSGSMEQVIFGSFAPGAFL